MVVKNKNLKDKVYRGGTKAERYAEA